MTILVVDDNRHMRRMLLELVGGAYEGRELLEAPDGATALALCRETQPDVILMDISLPDSNGIELTQEIRTMLPASKVVIVSCHRSTFSQDAARRAGASAYVLKEEVFATLLPALASVIPATETSLGTES